MANLKVKVQITDVLDRQINALLKQATGSSRSKPISATLTVKEGHSYWAAQEYGTGTRRQTYDGALRMPSRRPVKRVAAPPVRSSKSSKASKAGRQRKERREQVRRMAGWYIIRASGAAGGNGRTLSYLKDGRRVIRPYTYHPGVRPIVVGSGDPSRERIVNIGFGPTTGGSYQGLSGGRPQFESHAFSRGLIRVVLFRAQRRIVAEFADALDRQLKFRAIGQGDSPRSIRDALKEIVEINMKKAVTTLRQKMSRSANNPDTGRKDPRRRGGPLADAFGYVVE